MDAQTLVVRLRLLSPPFRLFLSTGEEVRCDSLLYSTAEAVVVAIGDDPRTIPAGLVWWCVADPAPAPAEPTGKMR
jgi:hypothetical protein